MFKEFHPMIFTNACRRYLNTPGQIGCFNKAVNEQKMIPLVQISTTPFSAKKCIFSFVKFFTDIE